jgi:hypothetical protein
LAQSAAIWGDSFFVVRKEGDGLGNCGDLHRGEGTSIRHNPAEIVSKFSWPITSPNFSHIRIDLANFAIIPGPADLGDVGPKARRP